MTFDNNVEFALAAACDELEMTRQEMIKLIVREWLETYGFLPLDDLDEQSDTKGNA